MSEEPNVPAKHEEEDDDEQQKAEDKSTAMNRKEKRKEMKKKKRREKRRELAEKEREEEEAKLNDPDELKRMELLAEEDRLRMEKERIEFEEHERIWLEKIRKEDEEEEERRRTKVLDDLDAIEAVDNEDGSDWEYVEEGPAEIIWKGNEIIVKKKKIRVPKMKVDQQLTGNEKEVSRPTSNPLPPQSEAFTHHNNAFKLSAPDIYENVALQVPNFGTEQDKSHCPFHIKTGACRFGKRCSRVHFYPDKSCTLLIKNMYNGPGLAWEQDEGLEKYIPKNQFDGGSWYGWKGWNKGFKRFYEEVERSYEEFYEDVHTEFLKFGEIVNFKVCKNGSFHLRGNVYVHFKSLESAILAYQYINGRFFAGKQLTCEYVGVTKWRIAICGEYMKSRLKTCSRGTACNFIHCFRNPGGDYEWADWDKPPPRFWIEKMISLFGYSDDAAMESESRGPSRSSRRISPADESRHRSRRSKSRETDWLSNGSGRRLRKTSDEHDSAYYKKHRGDERKRRKVRDEKNCEHETNYNDFHRHKTEVQDTDSDRYSYQRDSDRYNGHEKRRSRHRSKTRESDSDEHVADLDMERDTRHGRTRESSRHRSRTREADSDEYVADLDTERDTRHGQTRVSSRHRRRTHEADSNESAADFDMKRDTRHSQTHESSRHRNKENSANRRKMSINTDSDRKNFSHENEEVSELSDDHGDKNMNAESDISQERLKETRHERTRKSTKHDHRDSKNVGGGTRKRNRDVDSGGDGSGREGGSKKHHHRNRQSSIRQGDHGKTKKKTDWDEIDRMPVK